MKDEFVNYMKAISLSTTLTGRVQSILEVYSGFCPEEIKWMFISDYLTHEGERVFESVYLFSENFAMESKQFASSDNFDFARIEGIHYVEIKKQDYDLKRSTEKSRLNLRFHFSEKSAYLEMKASKENCEYLWHFFGEYVLPRSTRTK